MNQRATDSGGLVIDEAGGVAMLPEELAVELSHAGRPYRKPLVPARVVLPYGATFLIPRPDGLTALRLPLYQGRRMVGTLAVPLQAAWKAGELVHVELRIDQAAGLTARCRVRDEVVEAAVTMLEPPTERAVPPGDGVAGHEPERPTGDAAMTAVLSKAIVMGVEIDGGLRRREIFPELSALPTRECLTWSHQGETEQLRIPLFQGGRKIQEIAVPIPPSLKEGASITLDVEIDELSFITARVTIGDQTIEASVEPPPEESMTTHDATPTWLRSASGIIPGLADIGQRASRTIADAAGWRSTDGLGPHEPAPPGHPWEAIARRLERDDAVGRLVAHLLPNAGGPAVSPARLRFLAPVIEGSPALAAALHQQDGAAVRREWSKALAGQRANPRFLHGLAVLYREQSLAELDSSRSDEPAWLFSTALWAALLAGEEFWEYFSPDRTTVTGGDERRRLEAIEQDRLRDSSMRSILGLHRDRGSRDLAAGRRDLARLHARCLDLCRSGQKAVAETLSGYGLRTDLRPNVERVEQIASLADGLLDDWCSGLVREADRIVDDPDAIQRLPEGIRKNYEGGINHLAPFIGLGIPVVRVLRASLDWYNEWCYDLHVTKQRNRITALMTPARAVADKLVPLCTKARGHLPENQALSQHFLLRGFITQDKDPKQASEEYRQALTWNPANQNAQELLGQAGQAVIMAQIDVAIECMERKQFTRAYEVLDSVERQATDKGPVRQARAGVAFRHAVHEAEQGHFRAGLEQARKALALEPKQPAITDLVRQLEELAPEETAMQEMRAAQEAFQRDHYDTAIRHAANVPSRSRFANEARRLRSAAHFHRGIDAANNSQLDAAIRDLQEALKLNDNPEEQRIISQQLGKIHEANAGREIQAAVDRQDWDTAVWIMRRILGSGVSRQERQQLEPQLAMLLNMQAVSLANESQEEQKAFADYIQGVTVNPYNRDDLLRQFEQTQASANAKARQAVALLEEAAKLDKRNGTIKQNLDMIRKLA